MLHICTDNETLVVDMDFIMPFILLNDDETDDQNKLLTMILLSSLSGGLDMPNGKNILILWSISYGPFHVDHTIFHTIRTNMIY